MASDEGRDRWRGRQSGRRFSPARSFFGLLGDVLWTVFLPFTVAQPNLFLCICLRGFHPRPLQATGHFSELLNAQPRASANLFRVASILLTPRPFAPSVKIELRLTTRSLDAFPCSAPVYLVPRHFQPTLVSHGNIFEATTSNSTNTPVWFGKKPVPNTQLDRSSDRFLRSFFARRYPFGQA